MQEAGRICFPGGGPRPVRAVLPFTRLDGALLDPAGGDWPVNDRRCARFHPAAMSRHRTRCSCQSADLGGGEHSQQACWVRSSPAPRVKNDVRTGKVSNSSKSAGPSPRRRGDLMMPDGMMMLGASETETIIYCTRLAQRHVRVLSCCYKPCGIIDGPVIGYLEECSRQPRCLTAG